MMDMGMHGILTISSNSAGETVVAQAEAETGLRRGSWTVEEDLLLVSYIAVHGEGRWNSLARSAGLKRSGKSCRLRWLNYLRPGVRRGNFSAEEQLLILELHSRWGNRWSKIAQHLPGRTDNEIKNYWRTRVQKHAKQLKCDVNSQQFRDAMRYLWMPRLMEMIQANSASFIAAQAPSTTVVTASIVTSTYVVPAMTVEPDQYLTTPGVAHVSLHPDLSSAAGLSSDLSGGTWLLLSPVSNLTDCYDVVQSGDAFPAAHMVSSAGGCSESPQSQSPCGYIDLRGVPDVEQSEWETLWAADDIWIAQLAEAIGQEEQKSVHSPDW